MKSLLLAASAALPVLTGIPAQAADMPVKTEKYRPPAVYNWTGVYFGGHLGAGWATNRWRTPGAGVLPEFNLGSEPISGYLGGAQIGVNYQVNTLVFGIEADASWSNLSGEACNTATVLICNSQTGPLVTVAGRFGVAVDRALVFFKGGAAWVHDTQIFTVIGSPEAVHSDRKWGWTAGTGIEYALTRNWSAKLEYDVLAFGATSISFDTGALGLFPAEIKQRVQAVKAGLNYKLDWGVVGPTSY